MGSKTSKYIAESTKGADNSNEFFKEARIDDSNGMVKYAVDVDNDMEKVSAKVKSQLPKLSTKQEES
jgi:hypothetical protein